MSPAFKPRVLIDLKTVLMIMVFFGFGTWGAVWVGMRKGVWYMVEPSVKKTISDSLGLARSRTALDVRDASIAASAQVIMQVDQLQEMLVEMPGGKEAARKVRERKQARKNMYGYNPSPTGIFVF